MQTASFERYCKPVLCDLKFALLNAAQGSLGDKYESQRQKM